MKRAVKVSLLFFVLMSLTNFCLPTISLAADKKPTDTAKQNGEGSYVPGQQKQPTETTTPASGAVTKADNCETGCALNLPQVAADRNLIQKILAFVFGLIGAITLLIIVLSAINFVTGGGDPEKISRAKKSIIFALVGLVICISAETIVLTVLDKV